MCFLPLKSSHYPSWPVPVPELFGKYPTRPVPKSKTPTRQTPWGTQIWQNDPFLLRRSGISQNWARIRFLLYGLEQTFRSRLKMVAISRSRLKNFDRVAAATRFSLKISIASRTRRDRDFVNATRPRRDQNRDSKFFSKTVNIVKNSL